MEVKYVLERQSIHRCIFLPTISDDPNGGRESRAHNQTEFPPPPFLRVMSSFIHKSMYTYYQQLEPCAVQLMCARGRESFKLTKNGKTTDKDESLIEEVFQYIDNIAKSYAVEDGGENGKKRPDLMQKLKKAFRMGKLGKVADCTTYKPRGVEHECTTDTSKISNAIDSIMGTYF